MDEQLNTAIRPKTNLPPELTFNKLSTRGFYSVFKPWNLYPVSQGNFFAGQLIQIFFKDLTSGVLDPWRSYFQITVSVNPDALPVGLLQLDGSAQSFFQQVIISSTRSRQVERIIQYGSLANYLDDIGLTQMYCQGRQTQGLGYNNIGTKNINDCGSFGSSMMQTNYDWQLPFGVSANNTIQPTIPNRFNTFSTWGEQSVPLNSAWQSAKTHCFPYTPASNSTMNQVGWWDDFIKGRTQDQADRTGYTVQGASVMAYGYAYNIRAEYLKHISDTSKWVDSTTSNSHYQIRLDGSVMNNTYPAKFSNSTVYTAFVPSTFNRYFQPQEGDGSVDNIPNVTSLMGFTNLYSSYFTRGTHQPFISPTVPQCQMQNGKILSQKIPIIRKTFKIPLMSAVLGILIPKSQFLLIPCSALTTLLMQILIDQNAMFTSGYNDISQYDNVGMGLQQKRAFVVQKLIYKAHTYQFIRNQINQTIQMNLNQGIAINTNFWQLANQYQVQNSQMLNNRWPIACNQQALNEVVILFYPVDYQVFSFCRKHFRISNNITSFQLVINMTYFPQMPIQGNGGNPIQLDDTGDNSVYLQQIYWSNGYMFNRKFALPRINAYNFAINERCYNIRNTNTFYDPDNINSGGYAYNANSINVDTAMGMSLIHQNRYVGKAAYVYSFEPYGHSANYLTGLNTKQTKQFDVKFTTAPQNPFNRPQQMLIFTRSSAIIQYSDQGVININK